MKIVFRMWVVMFVALQWCLRAADSPPAEPAAQARMGINLAGPADWMTESPFVDVFCTSRPWVCQKKGAAFDQRPKLAATLEWAKSRGQTVEMGR